MEISTPNPATLDRLTTLATVLEAELGHLPDAQACLAETGGTPSAERRHSVHDRINDFWAAVSARSISRRELFVIGIELALRDEVKLSIDEGELHRDYGRCLPGMDEQAQVEFSSLRLQLDDNQWVEIAGAIVATAEHGPTLLALPGQSVEGFVSRQALQEALSLRMNQANLRQPLLSALPNSLQAAVTGIESEGDLFLETFSASDWQLTPLRGSPFDYAFDRLLDKQRTDIDALLGAPNASPPLAAGLESLIRAPYNWGPRAAITALEERRRQRQEQRQWPHWLKMASVEQRQRYLVGLLDYEQTRSALNSVMGAAASPQQYARIHVQARIANDLGHDLEPDALLITTQRPLPHTGETYSSRRSLTQLALSGLHPGDLAQGSALLTRTQITLDHQPLEARYLSLTPAYIANLIGGLNLRVDYRDALRLAYGQEPTQRLMRELVHQQLLSYAYAALLQGHILASDFALIETLNPATTATKNTAIAVQQLKLNGNDGLGDILLLRKLNPAGELDGLLLFTPNAPRPQRLQRLDSERQLRNELVGWTRSPALKQYLLQQVTASRRDALNDQLDALSERPAPGENFIGYTTFPDYDTGLRALVSSHVRITLSEQSLHTPDWLLRTPPEQRQQLLALEDALVGGRELYDAQPHTHIVAFQSFVHRCATRKINELLGQAEGSVDPDQIVITSERETLTYTQMLRDGYDDSIGPLSATADTFATFSGPEGLDVSMLTAEKVAASVRGQWLSDRYIAKIRSQLLAPESAGYSWRRRQSLLLLQLQMSADALCSRLKGQIDEAQYLWLRRSIDNMADNASSTRRRYPVYPLQLKVDVLAVAVQVETLQGCYLLLPEGSSTRAEALIYTPDAPDGMAWRPLATFCNTLLSEGMGDYYLARGRQAAGRALAFALAALKQGKAQAPTLPDRPFADLQDACFNQVLLARIRDVEESTTRRSEMLARLTWHSLEAVAVVLTLPFPPASFAVGIAMAGVDSYLSLAALSDNDHQTASFHLLSAWLNAAGAAGDLHSGIKGLGGMLKDIRGTSPSARTMSAMQAWRTQSPLQPLAVEDELFWGVASGPNRHVPLFRTHALRPESLEPTGHFAQHQATGTWTALRPSTPAALPSSHLVVNPAYAVNVSLADSVLIDSGHAHGIHLLRGSHYIRLHTQVFQVQYDASLRAWHIVDPNNPFAFFGRQPVRLDEQGQWQLLQPARLRGGVLPSFRPLQETPPGPSTAVGDLSDYEMPESLQPYVFGIVSRKLAESFGDGPFSVHELFDDIFQSGRETYATLRQNLYRDAKAFFEHPTLGSKPELPTLAQDATVQAFFEAALERSNGLVIGEAPTSVASKQLLIENMPLLAEQKVQVLYLEHLHTDQHVHKLQKYRALGSKTRSGSHQLKHHFDTVNDGALKNRSDKLDYYHVIKAAHRHGIEVKPFSSSVSYDFTDNEVATALGDELAQQKMSAFFGNKVISADVQSHPQRRWIALLDHRIANAWQQQPGISELQGALSLRVEDVAKGRPLRIGRDTEALDDAALTRADFRLQMANPNLTEAASAAAREVEPVSPLDDALYTFFERRSPFAWGLDPNRKAIVSQRKTTAISYAGEHGFEWDPAGFWLRSDAAAWKSEYPMDAIGLSLLDNRYQMPADMRGVFHDVANFHHRGLNPNYFFVEPGLVRVRERFFELSKTLQQDARSVLSRQVPARVTLPEVKADTPTSMFLEELYENTSGVVIGETHGAVASKRLILDNFEHLARQDVKTLYMEHLLTDIHQADLDRFAETGQMSKTLLHDLKAMDKHLRTDRNGVYTFEQLIIQARRHGIDVRAIDCAASYFIRNLSTTGATTRQQVFSFFASRTIDRHQDVIGAHKWIALVGESHANTFQNSVPGLAELERGIGVRVMDVASGKGRGIMVDPGEHLPMGIGGPEVFLKNDFRIEMELPPRSPIPVPVGDRLYNPGMFLVDESNPRQPLIIHRSRNRSLKQTPIRFDTQGRVYIEQESWPKVHRQRFDDIQSLADALVSMNLTHVA